MNGKGKGEGRGEEEEIEVDFCFGGGKFGYLENECALLCNVLSIVVQSD